MFKVDVSFFPLVAHTFAMSEEDVCQLLFFQWGVLDRTHFESLNQMMIFEEDVEKDGHILIKAIFLLFPYPKKFSQFFSSHWKK